MIASDGESTGIKVEDHNNPYGTTFKIDGVQAQRRGGVPENLGLVTDANGGWQVIQDLVGKEKRYYFVDKDPSVPKEVPDGAKPYDPIVVKPGDEWSLQNGDKSYGWVDTELNEEGGEWKSIPQSQPLLVSRGAKTVSVTLDNHPRGKTGSRQGVVAGIFIPTDQGDAPKSYGEASHILDNWNVTGQPKQNPDVAFEAKNRVDNDISTRDGGRNWSDDAKKDSEEDVSPNAFKDGFEKSNGKVTFPATAKDSDVVAWVDLDNNGTFDDSERRVGVVKDGNVAFDWSDAANKPEPGKDYYARIRVGGEGVKADDMLQPTGVVQGGEVEDLKFTVEKKPEPLVSLGDKVWFDQDSDGLQTDGEPGVKNVKVSLLDEQGNPVKQPGTDKPYEIITGDNGEYLFENLPKGKYKVQFDYSAARTSDDKPFTAFTVPGPDVDGKTEQDSDVKESKLNSIGLTDVIDLQSDRLDVDAGLVVVSFAPTVSVGDFVWHDKNNDGIQNDGDDSGIPGVELRILDPEGNPAKDIDGKLVANALTDDKGKYLFENLPVLKDDQSYTVEVVKDPEGFVPAKSDATNTAEDSSTKSEETAPGALTKDGAQDLTLDFSFVKLGSLSGMTWFDADRDGIRDDNEKPRAGVTVTLLRDGNPVESVNPVETGEDGTYKFENLAPGTDYSVCFGETENLTKKSSDADVTKEKDSNADPITGETATAEVKVGEDTPNLDDGYIFEPETKNSVTVAHQGETQKSTDNDSEKFGNITDAGITPAEMFPGVDPTLLVEYKLVDASDNPTDKVEVPGQGTFTIDSDGVVTFEPHPDFVGVAKTVVVTATQGEVTHVAHYTPIVIPKESDGEFPLPHFVDKGETGEPVTVTPGKGNHPDYPADLLPETVKFVEDGQPEGAEISEDGKKMTVPGQGVWTIDENGNFTFTPEPDFVGSPDTVKYNGEDADGNPGTNNGTVTITYPVPEGNSDLIRNLLIAGGVRRCWFASCFGKRKQQWK
ncbi:SdrD B-like domain-containing protein [Corynebacterium silvaticum]|uniref:CshA/CshB family fibrillar adhesin-related protein n=1 Tax=Corynebacterium silvaticum TaxID=2320431 RepID=A0ACD4PY58_9CORY|nr:SdrD B-like domain-containing protein [Corynebacterium silvaticum]WCV10620.1 CshA/CshB family fibrillar adhesin-related protein [Corynebacterium silvaticum]